eukprot:135505-Amphidinium_carterae.1
MNFVIFFQSKRKTRAWTALTYYSILGVLPPVTGFMAGDLLAKLSQLDPSSSIATFIQKPLSSGNPIIRSETDALEAE